MNMILIYAVLTYFHTMIKCNALCLQNEKKIVSYVYTIKLVFLVNLGNFQIFFNMMRNNNICTSSSKFIKYQCNKCFKKYKNWDRKYITIMGDNSLYYKTGEIIYNVFKNTL